MVTAAMSWIAGPAVEEDHVRAAAALALVGNGVLAGPDRGGQAVGEVHAGDVGVHPVELVDIGVGQILGVPAACRGHPQLAPAGTRSVSRRGHQFQAVRVVHGRLDELVDDAVAGQQRPCGEERASTRGLQVEVHHEDDVTFVGEMAGEDGGGRSPADAALEAVQGGAVGA